MRHTFVVFVEDKPGVLNRVVSVIRRRLFNVESLSVGQTHQKDVSRITMVVNSEKKEIERIIPYLYKLVNVLYVEDITQKPFVSRDLVMVKVCARAETRSELMMLSEVYRARIVDVSNQSFIFEVTGDEEKVNRFVENLRPYGIIEMARTGTVAMERGTDLYTEQPMTAQPVSMSAGY